jgi:hypothetical protein
MFDTETEFTAGLSEGFTWSSIGKSLAGGVVSGIGAWAVARFLDTLFGNGKWKPELFKDFTAQSKPTSPNP